MSFLTVPTVLVFALFGLYHAIQANRLRAEKEKMEYFLNIAAHDIRSPLTVIHQALEMMRNCDGIESLTGEQVQYASIASNQSVVIKELIDELLDLYRMEKSDVILERQPIAIVPLVQKAISEMDLRYRGKKLQVQLDIDLPKGEVVDVNGFKIRQVIRNLLSNAIRYTPVKGVIHVALRRVNHHLELSVANEGPSIPEAKLRKIFDKFVQAQDRDQQLGFGLGLPICKSIVELHGGKIWVENKQDPSGVSFFVQLPASK